MKASYVDMRSGEQREIEVPREHWEELRSSLLPAKRDKHPAKWVVLGQLDLTKEDDSRFEIELYAVRQGPGAFAAGKSHDERVYYRGGKTEDLMKALQAADPTLETKP
ncbi:hypothetical protein [Singulisphaera sp. PoT]|uniref:hypothetical protein n=1 Tax=Singulisphaera sp. PoT TaxID=3411797 RepID=UPI003BF5F2FA